MSGDAADGPTLGEVYWWASGARIPAYADLPDAARERMERGAAAVGAAAIARYAVQAVKAAAGETVVIATGRDVPASAVRGLIEMFEYVAPGVSVAIVDDVAALKVWHPDDAPAELRAAMAEARRLRDLLDQATRELGLATMLPSQRELGASLRAQAGLEPLPWNGRSPTVETAFLSHADAMAETRAVRESVASIAAGLEHRADINRPSRVSEICDGIAASLRTAIGARS